MEFSLLSASILARILPISAYTGLDWWDRIKRHVVRRTMLQGQSLRRIPCKTNYCREKKTGRSADPTRVYPLNAKPLQLSIRQVQPSTRTAPGVYAQRKSTEKIKRPNRSMRPDLAREAFHRWPQLLTAPAGGTPDCQPWRMRQAGDKTWVSTFWYENYPSPQLARSMFARNPPSCF
jgi:hypothetical protein